MTISDYDALIKAAKEEIENCEKLKKLLLGLSDNSFNCTNELRKTHDRLSEGLSEKGITANIKIISDRADYIEKMQLNLEQPIQNIDARIIELEKNIAYWEMQIQELLIQEAILRAKRKQNINLEEE